MAKKAQAAQSNGNTNETQDAANGDKKTVVFETREQALAAKPEDNGMKLYAVANPEGETLGWAYAKWGATATLAVVRKLGWKATSEGKAPTKEKVAGLLSQLSPEDRAALLAEMAAATKSSRKK
jgi:hypothetical protein